MILVTMTGIATRGSISNAVRAVKEHERKW
jgi:hypothetical protein